MGRHMENHSIFHISDMLQNIIYFFNQQDIRDHTIGHYKKMLPHGKNIDWDGTYYFNEYGIMDPYYHKGENKTTLLNFIKNRPLYQRQNHRFKSKNYFILFTCCILYEENRVHYLSFIFRPHTGMLISFDPGIHLYTKGQDILVPLIRDTFLKAGFIRKNNLERVGLCKDKYHNRRWGIQYNGTDPNISSLPADSFCQSWTLFFLIEFIRHGCSDHFFRSWCKIPPKSREIFILMYYFLPWLQHDAYISKKFEKFYPQGDLRYLLDYISEHYKNNFPVILPQLPSE
jgi:hypothetical protein